MSNRDLVYRISVHGQADAISAIRSVADEARRQALDEAKAIVTSERAKLAARKNGLAAARALLAEESAATKKAAADATAAEKKAASSRVKLTEDEVRGRIRIRAEETKGEIRLGQEAVRAHQNVEREKTRATEQASRQRAASERQTAQETAREIRRVYDSMPTGAPGGTATTNGSGAPTGLRGGGGVMGDKPSGTSAALKWAAGKTAQTAREVANGLGIDRAWAVGDMASERMAISEGVTAVGIESRNAGEKNTYDKAAAEKKIAQVAAKTGYTQVQLLDAVKKYSEKGSGARAVGELEEIAMQARAMGADPEDVARVRANLGAQGANTEQVNEMIALMHSTGKTGVFQAKEVAKSSEAMLGAFGPGVVGHFKDFISFANETRRSVGSGREASTAFKGAIESLDKKRDKIEELGVSYTDENGEDRAKVDVLKDTIVAAKGDRSVLAKLFPKSGYHAIETMIRAHNGEGTDAQGRKIKGKGLEAINALLAGDPSLAKSSVEDMNVDAKDAIEEDSIKLKVETEKARQNVTSIGEPIVRKGLEWFNKLVDSPHNSAETVRGSDTLQTMFSDHAKPRQKTEVGNIFNRVFRGGGTEIPVLQTVAESGHMVLPVAPKRASYADMQSESGGALPMADMLRKRDRVMSQLFPSLMADRHEDDDTEERAARGKGRGIIGSIMGAAFPSSPKSAPATAAAATTSIDDTAKALQKLIRDLAIASEAVSELGKKAQAAGRGVSIIKLEPHF